MVLLHKLQQRASRHVEILHSASQSATFQEGSDEETTLLLLSCDFPPEAWLCLGAVAQAGGAARSE